MTPETPRDTVSLDDAGSFPLDEASEPPSTDPFAAFAPIASAAPKHDLSFDLSTAFAIQPKAAPPAEAAVDFGMAPRAEPVEAISQEFPLESIEPDPIEAEPIEVLQSAGSEAELDLELEAEAEPERHVDPILQMPAESGPDPAVLATLARLERFLVAIESLRA
jgi:hypothetical protein